MDEVASATKWFVIYRRYVSAGLYIPKRKSRLAAARLLPLASLNGFCAKGVF